MIIDFEKIEEEVLPRFKDGEKEVHTRRYKDDLNIIMQSCLHPGASIGYHCHETSSEIIFITGGRGYVVYDGERIPVQAGMCHYCPKNHSHSMVNDSDEDLFFTAIVPQQ